MTPNVRFYRFDDFVHDGITFLIRNFDSVTHKSKLIVRLHSQAAIEEVRVHGRPFCAAPPVSDGKGNILITFDKVPADATFVIKVKRKSSVASDQVMLWLADRSELRPRHFDKRLEPFRGARRARYFFVRALVGLLGFIAMFWIGVTFTGDAPTGPDWPFIAVATPAALVVFVLVVPTAGKSTAAGYLGWNGASRDWLARHARTTS
jgi:hypothetical protein